MEVVKVSVGRCQGSNWDTSGEPENCRFEHFQKSGMGEAVAFQGLFNFKASSAPCS